MGRYWSPFISWGLQAWGQAVTCSRGQLLILLYLKKKKLLILQPEVAGHAMRARAGCRTRSVRARTGRKASSLDPCRESDFLSTIFLILIAQTTLGPIAGPETLPFP